MKKTVLFFLLILGTGISLISNVEAYTVQEETVCIDKITEYHNDCVALNTKGSEYYMENEYAKVFTYGEQQRLCINQIEKYVKQQPACADFGKQVVDGHYKVLTKRMALTNYMVDLSCKKDYGKYSVGHTGANLCDCMDGYIWNNDQTSCIEKPSINLELQEAITWMYNQGLTSYATVAEFMGNDYLTREQASKFFVQFARRSLAQTPDSKKIVKLSDLKKANPTLQSYIKEANQLGLFKGTNGKFLPQNKLTRAQAIAVIIRAVNGSQTEKSPRYLEYYNMANQYQILGDLDFSLNTLDSINIKRNEMALLLYRMSLIVVNYKEANNSCQTSFGINSYSDGSMADESNYNCYCQEGYDWNKAKTQCLPANQSCEESFGKYSYRGGTYENGDAICECKEGYDRESDKDSAPCVKK